MASSRHQEKDIAGYLCSFAMGERAECGYALKEREKYMHRWIFRDGGGGVGCGVLHSEQNHTSFGRVKDHLQRGP